MPSDEVDWDPAEVNWNLYQSDLKVSRMVIKKPRPILNFEIPVIPQPPLYRPGRGPPSQPVDLRLLDDSTAFIVDKIILPLEPFTELGDPRQRRAYYIIGWPDLPAARPVVDCTKALDYVPPHAIEQWEYEDFLRREAEMEQAATEAALAAVAEAIAAEKGKGVAGAKTLPNGKKPGRKPKNAKLQNIRPPTPQLDSEQEELLAKRKQGPSLSTPQKRQSRIAQLDAEMEMEPLDHMDENAELDEEIRRQLESEGSRGSAASLGEGENESDLLQDNNAVSDVAVSSRASSVRLTAPVDNLPLGFLQPPRIPPISSSVQQQRSSSSSTTPSHPNQVHKPISTTPIPLPQRPRFGSTSRVTLFDPPRSISSIEPSTPSAHRRARATQPLTTDPDAAQAASSSFSAYTSNGSCGGFTPTNNLTPGGGYLPRPPKRPAVEPLCPEDNNQSTSSGTKVKRERKKKAPKLLQPSQPTDPAADPSIEPQVEREYVVKRLEDDSFIDGVQYFKVRWEGDWPPEQNPTWEPRENISAKLVQAYLKRKAEKAKNTATMGKSTLGRSKGNHKEKHQSTLKQWAKKLNYSSVSEAFEGQAELDQINGKTHGDHNFDDNDNDELGGDAAEFFVVDNKRKAEEREKAAAERRKSLSSQVAAGFASMSRGRTTDF